MESSLSYTAGREMLWWVRMYSLRQRWTAGQPYWHDNADRKYQGDSVIQYTLSGEIVYRDAQGERVCGPGSILLFSYGEASQYGRRNQQPYCCSWLNLCGPGLAEQWRAIRESFGSVVDLRGDTRIYAEMGRLAELADHRRPAPPLEVAGAVQRFVLLLVRTLLEGQAAQQTPVQRAVDELLRQPISPWSLKQVADRFGCSREHLVRVFTEKMGQPPGQYLAQIRTEAAVRMLQHTSLPLKQVARQAGFGTVHTMIRRVRKVTGLTPSQLRQQQR